MIETAFKHFVPSFVIPSDFDAYVVKCFALINCIVLRLSSQICGEMSSDLLTNRKHLNEIFGLFVHAQNAINAIWRLTLPRMLTQSLELKCAITFVV